jgi:hypothetical protein
MTAKYVLPILALVFLIASPLLSQTIDSIDLNNDGYIDGIYKCNADYDGKSASVMVAMNGRGDGTELMMFAADTRETGDFYGFATGTVGGENNSVFSGTTQAGVPFTFSIQYGNQIEAGFYDNITLEGDYVIPNGSTAHMTCDQAY